MSAPMGKGDGRRAGRRFRFRIRTAILFVSCCATVFWAAREIRDRRPENAMQRALRMMQSDDPDDRIQGTAALSQMVVLNSLTPSQLDAVTRPILVALRDPEGRVRREAMDARFLDAAPDAWRRTDAEAALGRIRLAAPRNLSGTPR